ncbi:hypothetical protein FUAX_02660 [Fulvitalea axinellae]|uniref:Tetratricopeptide repeat protein n=1 Tax=Fulvitalea axinellae TaxID=1182444 RepID=A0AAU9D098_9BACT|nr:hypothetical protein FUAX_02660 [Fulvitalea axinellae]
MGIKSLTLSIVLTLACATVTFAQAGWNWPSDPQLKEKATEENVLYTDYLKQGQYNNCRAPLNWLLRTVPDLNKSLYINGVKIYENLARTEQNAAQKKVFQDSTLLLYDLRIKYYGDEANVLVRKAYSAYKFFYKDKSKNEYLYTLFTKAFEANNNTIPLYLAEPYMNVISRYKKSGGPLTDLQVVDLYDRITAVLAEGRKTSKNPAKIDQAQGRIDELLTKTVEVNCAFIAETLAPKFKKNPTDLRLAQNIFKLALAVKCIELPVFIDAAKVVYQNQPTFGLAKLIGRDLITKKDYDDALKYLDMALPKAEDSEDKADIYMLKASVYYHKQLKTKAREYAFKAVAVDPSRKEAYTFVGNLYFGSYQQCKKGVSKVADRAVFLAAYDMYLKAGDKKGMANAKAQFPSKEELFSYNIDEGSKIKVGCWINVTATVRAR